VIIYKLVKEFNNYFLLRSEILVGYFKILLIYLTRRSDTAPQPISRSANAELVNRFFSSVEKQFLTNKKVTDYASHLAVTPNYLNEIVKRISGFPASYHIQQRIVLEAKRHATYSGASMKEIAYHLGFEDIAHFSKYFKNVAGQSFSAFKKRAGSQLGIA
jgi:AraC-like DNA-binding protein